MAHKVSFCQLNFVVQDMAATIDFYHRLGLEFEAEPDTSTWPSTCPTVSTSSSTPPISGPSRTVAGAGFRRAGRHRLLGADARGGRRDLRRPDGWRGEGAATPVRPVLGGPLSQCRGSRRQRHRADARSIPTASFGPPKHRLRCDPAWGVARFPVCTRRESRYMKLRVCRADSSAASEGPNPRRMRRRRRPSSMSACNSETAS
jgi:catechol 2,3-dioxygenase-like lactoylglutathione lyase family enzyme